MPRTARKATVKATGTAVRHEYVPHDFVSDESWKQIFPMTDPLIPVTMDRGTFEWLWDFVARKGRQADASNFHYSGIQQDVYRRAADQFAIAASEAFGDTYKVKEAKPVAKKGADKPAEVVPEPSEPRKRRKRVSATVETLKPAESLARPSRRKRRRKPRSEA